jgi:hypothetical protein
MWWNEQFVAGTTVASCNVGITILAPLIKREIVEERENPEPHVVGFRAVSVLDVAQTDGEPLRGMPELLQTADHGQLLEAIR